MDCPNSMFACVNWVALEPMHSYSLILGLTIFLIFHAGMLLIQKLS